MAKFTYQEFKKRYPDDMACLDKIFQLRYGHLQACPSCACPASWRRVRTRRCYQCRHCYDQFYPTAGTPFEKTTKPLLDWFYIIFLFTTTRNGVAAKEIERQLGCTYKTAWRMGHQIRKLMDAIGHEQLKGFVEVDETYYTKGNEKDNSRTSQPVIGMVERTGMVRAFVVPKVNKETVFTLIRDNISPKAIINTDEFNLYKNINSELGNTHLQVKHQDKIYRIGSASTNTIEGYFSQLKRMIHGTHLHVSYKHLHSYVSECNLRYNNRHQPNQMFETILKNLPLKE